ncbi:MAG TPA: SLC45 family MFS transporter [Coprothermobacter proteolyticus]|uniref:SLC45 family MFS transporter n=1 Tax=Coprothermobacter proteolyticus TaxID=35786 RepID=UPI000D3212A6|nr:SLC45 family MFS transporter [Coprothermobacter proteolyticus]MBP8983532.1 SLC45 family MFS transporter [Coprothermobacter sp.]HOK24688.1 SLC45 family MFS transporter [Coprothermobacter proteolyticus]HOL53085.1 SLC45 family MFS transporter [Coprothermobacter proteolyticus]HPO83937.1 SLC45 family MFS transporter [Coprothermobacter proteolyticus]
MKIDYKKLFLLGFGFMGISVVWALYNADVPVILQSQFGMSNFATGWIMNIDNIFAVTLIPIIAAYSDKVSTKIGRRMPFIITGMPLMAVFFALVPWIPLLFGTSTTGLVIFMITVIVMNISAAVSRGPVIALMPDIVPPEQRSPANGVINFMGGLGSLLVYFGIGRISSQNRPLGFGIAAVITLVAAFVVYKAINEPRDAIYYKSQAEETPWWKNIGSLLNKEHKDLWFMLLAIFLWFIAYNAVETFYVVYMSLESGMDPTVAENLAKLNLGVMSLVFMVFALPAGWLANKFGRKRVMSFGLVFMLLAVTGIMFTRNALWLNLLFAMAGVGWAMININSLPTVVDMGSLAEVGTFTGLYYFSSQAASIVSPPLIGFISDLAKSKYVMFPYALIFFLLSLICLSNVRKGDIVTK